MGKGVFSRFYGDLGLGFWAWGFTGIWAWDLRVDIWHMGITGFWEYGVGIFWLDIWARVWPNGSIEVWGEVSCKFMGIIWGLYRDCREYCGVMMG